MIRASARKQALSAIRLWAPSRSANKQLRRIGRVGLWRKAMMLVTGEGTTDRPCSHGPLDAVGQLPRSAPLPGLAARLRCRRRIRCLPCHSAMESAIGNKSTGKRSQCG